MFIRLMTSWGLATNQRKGNASSHAFKNCCHGDWNLLTNSRNGERGGSVVECRTPEREVRGSRPTAAVLCPWARHFTPRKYWLFTQEVMAPSRHDWKIVDWDVKPQHNQPTNSRNALFYTLLLYDWTMHCEYHLCLTEIVKVARNFSMKIWRICKTWALELGVGWEIY